MGKKIKVVLELDVKIKGTRDMQTYRKKAHIFITPFPGLQIDDDSDMSKNDMRIVEHSVTVETVRCSMVTEHPLCYCKTEEVASKEDMEKLDAQLKRLDWHYHGFPG